MSSTVLDALGQPIRRAILEELAAGPLPVGVLAARLPVSRPATSQHLRVLKEARLVRETSVGTRREYRLDPTGFEALRRYLDRFWGDVLEGFAATAAAEAAAVPDAVPDDPTSTESRQP